MDTLRTFIAVPLSEAVRTYLAEYQAYLRTSDAIKWVETANLHVTLRFLGDTPIGDLPAITAALRETAAALSPFSIVIGELGFFPNRRSPRVIWIGVKEGKDALLSLHQQVEAALQKAGFPPGQGRFTPHVTLGRVRDGYVSLSLGEQLASVPEYKPVSDNINRIVFLRSVLTGRSPVYTLLADFSLPGGKPRPGGG